MNTQDQKILKSLFKQYYEIEAKSIEPLAETGSYRRYYRLSSEDTSILGVVNSDLRENKAYFSFSETFLKKNIKVPDIKIINDDYTAYLVEDLGNETLYTMTESQKDKYGLLSKKGHFYYEKTINQLIRIQNNTIDELDTSLCYPRDCFDFQSIIWDLYYFKYYCLKLLKINYDEQALEYDLNNLAQEMAKVETNTFLYRDFQSRNIIINNSDVYFIDFQGGRKGAIYYDIASLLYDANVELKQDDIKKLLEYYYDNHNNKNTDWNEFQHRFYQFAAIRLMQALGAFGLRGIIEKKPNFVECIPYAVQSLHSIAKIENWESIYPELNKNIKDLNDSEYIEKIISH